MKRVIRMLRIELVAVLSWAALLIILFETEVLPSGWMAGQDVAEYYMSIAGIMMLLVFVPMALKLFSFRFLRRLFSETGATLLPQRYRFWSEVRLAMLAVTGWVNLIFYYLMLDTSCAFCALVALAGLSFCWPSVGKMGHETGREKVLIDIEDEEKQKNA